MMKRLLYLSAIIALCTSCVHKELCLVHPHLATLRVEFDWKDAPEADPAGMCVYFYPLEGGRGQRFDFKGTKGGEVRLRVGKYRVLCYNNDTEIVEFYNTDDFGSHGVYTREGSVLEPIYGNAATYAPRAEGTEDERVVICPDMMWGCSSFEVEVKDTGVRRNVRNLKHLSQVCGSISSMSGTLEFSSEEIGKECVTLPFSGASDGVSKITGMFYTFGHHLDNPDPHRMAFYVVMDNGEKFCFKDGNYLDVTSQVHEAPDFRHVHIIIDGLDLPEPMENGSGFDPSVDDWEVVEGEIVM